MSPEDVTSVSTRSAANAWLRRRAANSAIGVPTAPTAATKRSSRSYGCQSIVCVVVKRT